MTTSTSLAMKYLWISKDYSSLEQNVVVVIDPEEQPEDLDFPYPADQLPDLPLVQPD